MIWFKLTINTRNHEDHTLACNQMAKYIHSLGIWTQALLLHTHAGSCLDNLLQFYRK